MYGDYNQYGRQETGFSNGFDHSIFGHWSNPEYQEMCQDIEQHEKEISEMYKNDTDNKSCDDGLPF